MDIIKEIELSMMLRMKFQNCFKITKIYWMNFHYFFRNQCPRQMKIIEWLQDQKEDLKKNQIKQNQKKRKRNEQTGNFINIARGFQKEALFFETVRGYLSPQLYAEFLGCVNLYIEELLSVEELSVLLKKLFQNRPDLMESCTKFLGITVESLPPVEIQPIEQKVQQEKEKIIMIHMQDELTDIISSYSRSIETFKKN